MLNVKLDWSRQEVRREECRNMWMIYELCCHMCPVLYGFSCCPKVFISRWSLWVSCSSCSLALEALVRHFGSQFQSSPPPPLTPSVQLPCCAIRAEGVRWKYFLLQRWGSQAEETTAPICCFVDSKLFCFGQSPNRLFFSLLLSWCVALLGWLHCDVDEDGDGWRAEWCAEMRWWGW